MNENNKYVNDYFIENRYDFLEAIKNELDNICANQKEYVCEQIKDFSFQVIRNQSNTSAMIVINDNLKKEKHFSISKIEPNTADDEIIKLADVIARETKEEINPGDFNENKTTLIYSYNDNENKIKKSNKLGKLIEYLNQENIDTLWKKNMIDKSFDEKLAFAKKLGFDGMGKGFIELISNKEYFHVLKEALLIKTKEISISEKLYNLRDLLSFINELSGTSFELKKDDINANLKYANPYLNKLSSWGLILDEIKEIFIKKEIIEGSVMSKYEYINRDKLIFETAYSRLIIDIKDAKNYDIYKIDMDTKNNVEQMLNKIKNDEIDPLRDVALSVKKGEVENVNEYGIYLLDREIKSVYKNLQEREIIPEFKEKYNYEYIMKYFAHTYEMSELSILYLAFVTLGSIMRFDKERGVFYSEEVMKNSDLNGKISVSDKYENKIYLMPAAAKNIEYLNNDWHNGLKKLLGHYNKHKKQVKEEMTTVFADKGIDIEKNFKKLNNAMNNLKKLDKKISEEKENKINSLRM